MSFVPFVFCLASVADALSTGFLAPPSEARPYTWWHWMNGNVSKSGITADLEAMRDVGIGGVQLFDVGLAIPEGQVQFATSAWYEHIVFAAREAERLGLSFGIANCSGWTSSGGPWITPDLGMKVVVFSEMNIVGGCRREVVMPRPESQHGYYRDIAIVAFPTPDVRTTIPDLDRRILKVRGSESGPFTFAPWRIEPGAAQGFVSVDQVVDLTERMKDDGSLVWDVPDGRWTVCRFGYAANGRRNRPPSRLGDGLECDKLSSRAVEVHFDAYVGQVVKALEGVKSFDNVLIDSYEVQGQNWTDGFEGEFEKRKGYSIRKYLPVMAGYPVGSVSVTESFLSDFRSVVGSLFVENYAVRMAELCHRSGLRLALEPYGNCPANDLEYARAADIPMAEFWVRRGDGMSMETRWGNRLKGNGAVVAASAHVWGRPIVGAEAFTSWPTATSGRWLAHPGGLKAQGDKVLADGVNRFYFHRFVHQPWTPTRYPGMTMAFYGTHFDRTQTWWRGSFKAYCSYLSRVQFMLQAGVPVVDLIVDVGDEVPCFGGGVSIPKGYKADCCTAKAFKKFQKSAGALISPGNVKYQMAVHPNDDVCARLKSQGLRPDFQCEDPNVTWCHRRVGNDEVYFVAREGSDESIVNCTFRDGRGKAVSEIWNPETGDCWQAKAVDSDAGKELELEFSPDASLFVVFRDAPTEGVRPRALSKVEASRPLTGRWKVDFHSPDGLSFSTSFETLSDWSVHPDARIRYFAGTASYTKSIFIEEGKDGRLVLDLGVVNDSAEVLVDGTFVNCVWKKPFRVALPHLKGGSHVLTIKVTNRWPNRLIGAANVDDTYQWRADNVWRIPVIQEIPQQSVGLFTTCKFYRGDDPLLSSGLLGPVKIDVVTMDD